MKRFLYGLICFIIALIAFIGTAYASELNLFSTDVDNDVYEIESIHFDTPEGIDDNWYPLRAISEYLPIKVDWDEETREVIIIDSRDRVFRYSYEFIQESSDMQVINGVTYCSSRFIIGKLHLHGLLYENSIYYFDKEINRSTFIIDNGNEIFRRYANESFFELYLKFPEDYTFIKHCLYGVEYVSKEEAFNLLHQSAKGYVYPFRREPICYIVGTHTSGTLSSLIAHEAYHVYQYRNRLPVTEDEANLYENDLLYRIISSRT